MKLEDFPEIKIFTRIQDKMEQSMSIYRQQHPQFCQFDFSEYFYFKIYNDRLAIHWAVIIKEEKWSVYFISMRGRAFDKLEFKTKKQAQRALRRNKFSFSTNKYCPYKPISPIYINIGKGKKSAPYSKGNLWQGFRINSKTEYCTQYTNLYKRLVDSQNYIKQSQEEPSGCAFLLFCIILATLIYFVEYFFVKY